MNELELNKRADTLAGILQKVVFIVIMLAAVIMALNEMGFNIAPLLASSGVAGLAIGFGAQSLVKDIVTGFFMLLENQIRVGDIVTINGTGGVVEEVNIRTTVLRDLEGIVAKEKGSAYLPGRRSAQWLKVKARQSADCVVVGYTRGKGERERTFGALQLARYDDGRLRYAGKVGTGFDEALMRSFEGLAV